MTPGGNGSFSRLRAHLRSMGYACPVCDAPQQDAEHLANHLAFTAMLRNEDHETWLDDAVPGWAQETPESLGDRVAEFAAETEFDGVFEDTTDGHHPPVSDPGRYAQGGGQSLDATAREILRDAQALTRERNRAADEAPTAADDTAADLPADEDAADRKDS